MKTKETTIKILFLAIVCALISATMFSMKPPRAVSYAETGICPHEYDDEEGLKERTCVRCHVKQQAILQKTAVPEQQKGKILSKSDIAGIVVGSVAAGGLVAFIGATLIKKRRKK